MHNKNYSGSLYLDEKPNYLLFLQEANCVQPFLKQFQQPHPEVTFCSVIGIVWKQSLLCPSTLISNSFPFASKGRKGECHRT